MSRGSFLSLRVLFSEGNELRPWRFRRLYANQSSDLNFPSFLSQRRTNPAFSKPCLFLSDTRHFRHFRRFRGSEEPSPCFQWVECKFVIFAVFVKMAPFWQGTKTRFTKNTVCATPTRGNGQNLEGIYTNPSSPLWPNSSPSNFLS